MAQQQQNTSSVQIPPLPAPLGVNKKFIINQPVTLRIRDEISFGGDVTITDDQGRDVVHADGEVMSMSRRKKFSSPAGEHLFDLARHKFSIPQSFYLEGPNGERFAEIEGRLSWGKPKLDVRFNNILNKGEEVLLEVRGDFFDRDSQITWDGQPVAIMKRSFGNWRQAIGDMETYYAMCAPGVDLVFIAAIIVGLDLSRKRN